MSSNYPPGVTGNEYAIGGAQREWIAEAECPYCGDENPKDHEAHYEFGVRAFCWDAACPGYDGFEIVDDMEYEPDLETD